MQLLTQSGDLGPKWFHVALRAMVLMAQSNDYLKSHQIADILGAESTFVRKILARLAKAKLVETCGGRYGGYKIQADPTQTTIYEVYLALTKDSYIKEQSLILNKTDQLIAKILTEAESQFSQVLNKYTIEDMKNTLTTQTQNK